MPPTALSPAAAAGDCEGQTACIPGPAPQLQGDRGLPPYPAGQVPGRFPAGAEGAPEAGSGGAGGNALQLRGHRPALPRHRHWQDGDRRHGRQAVWQTHAVSGPHGGTTGFCEAATRIRTADLILTNAGF